ncbi:uncharacterized protein LOC141910844 isoform X3 [Tubulanus polymorphus]|uniref:uncharacterized protein LOC141910844 isoform X3 n=1 Tax=Tubulanus polymorphus TaxID=672921 RepID=UPI003DA4E433
MLRGSQVSLSEFPVVDVSDKAKILKNRMEFDGVKEGSQESTIGVDEDRDADPNKLHVQYSPHRGKRSGILTSDEISDSSLGRSNPLQNSSGVLDSDCIKVEITDILDESINMTTTALRKCKSQVLRPYWKLLVFVGWRGFGRESIQPSALKWRILNTFYAVFVFSLLIYGYIYEALCCQWKLNVKLDIHPITISPPIIHNHTRHHKHTTTLSYYTLGPAETRPTSSSNPFDNKSHEPICQHVVTTYIIPNMLHMVAYIMGFVFFRLRDNHEQLYALMERVFLNMTALQGRAISQAKMIRKLRLYLVLGIMWVLLTVGLLVLFLFAFGINSMSSVHAWNMKHVSVVGNWIMFCIQMLAEIMISSVALAVTLNYVTQCEIIIFYIQGIHMKILDRSSDLKAIMKDITGVRHSLELLNGFMSQMTSLLTFTFAELVVLGCFILVMNESNEPKMLLYRIFFPVIFSVMFLWPLLQAGRMNSVCARFKRLALDMRVFGFRNASMIELDSFVSFVGQTHLRAKMFHIPVRTSYIAGISVVLCFIALILLQLGNFGNGYV